MSIDVVFQDNLTTDFLVDGTSGDLSVNIGVALVRAPDGTITVDITQLDIVSQAAGNLLTTNAGGAFFDQAALQAAETVWTGASTGFLTVTPAGTNGHAPTFALDFTNAAFVEGVQDAVGQAILAGSGISYDDVADSISSALGNVTWGNGLTATGLTNVAVLPDPNSPSSVTVTAAGVSVTPGISVDAGNLATLGTDQKVHVPAAAVTALATETICDLSGTPRFKAFPV